MKKLILLISIFIMTSALAVAAKHFWRGETMKVDTVCKTWGDTVDFNLEKFRKGSESERAQMSCSLLRNQKLFLGKDRSDIRKELGDHDGFYFSDMFPAYMIKSAQSKNEDSWQLVFLLNKNEKVSEIVVHKNCCDR